MSESKQKKTVRRILSQSQRVPLSDLKPYPNNPRIGNVEEIAKSLEANSQFQPIVVQKSTGYILSGNHTFKAAHSLGWPDMDVVYVDVDDEAAKRIVLAANRTADLASYDTSILSEILSSIPDPSVGTGYDTASVNALLEGIAESSMETVEAVLRPPITTSPLLDDSREWGEPDNSVSGRPDLNGQEAGEVKVTAFDDPEDVEDLSNELGELQGILQLSEGQSFPGNNYYGIPDLARNGLVDALPQKFDTWAGEDATPDDGVTTWLWNYGVAARKGLPMDRAILCFYTYDTYFESFWDQPAYMTAKMINAGIKSAVVPDYSYYNDMSPAEWIYSHFRAQWVGRYFQEAGIRVIPRIQFAIDKPDSASHDFNTLGIPKNAPVVAKSTQNSKSQDEFDMEVNGLQKALEKIEPGTLLMYGGNPAKRVIQALDPVGKGLCQEVVHLYNYAHKRRGVVYDKKEGLAGMKKDQQRRLRDRAENPEALMEEQKAELAAAKEEMKASKAKKAEQPDEGATL